MDREGDAIEAWIELLGPQQALNLFEARGGTRIAVPSIKVYSGKRSLLLTIMDVEAANKLIDAYAGLSLKIPIGRRFRIAVAIARGLTAGRIALQFAISRNTIQRTRAEISGRMWAYAKAVVAAELLAAEAVQKPASVEIAPAAGPALDDLPRGVERAPRWGLPGNPT